MNGYSLRNRLFYTVKPVIPRRVQLFVRRKVAASVRKKYAHIWPIDPNSALVPKGWLGWPYSKHFALVLSHDVDTRKGYNSVLKLAELEEQLGFRSQFNFVPERYGKVQMSLLNELKSRGFGIGVHGLKHDGKLFSSRGAFSERVTRINAYLKEWDCKGFTTPSMIRNHEWMHELNMDFCISTFDTDPFEPQSDGSGTIFPYWVENNSSNRRFLELPYTLVQDFTLFVILGEKNIALWKKKLDWIAFKEGMALLNSHPDWMNFNASKCGLDEYPMHFYKEFLNYAKQRYGEQYWPTLPSEVSDFFKARLNGIERYNSLVKKPFTG